MIRINTSSTGIRLTIRLGFFSFSLPLVRFPRPRFLPSRLREINRRIRR